MSYFQRCMKVHSARQVFKKYEYQKLKSVGKVRATFLDRIQERIDKCTGCLNYYISRVLLYHYVGVLWRIISTDGTLANYIVKSFLGFTGGCILIYFLYFCLVYQLHFTAVAGARTCFVFAPFLTLGLAFSQNVRCLVFLVLPQFFSKNGRQALLGYALIMALSGPGRNTLYNTEVLSSSIACGQEQLKYMAKQVLEAIKKPFQSIRDAMRVVMKGVGKIAKKIKELFLAIKRIVIAIVKAIRSMVRWLRNLLSICNNKMGTPYERCARAFDSAIADCNARLPWALRWLCAIAVLIKLVCHTLRWLDLICAVLRFIGDTIVGAITRTIKKFLAQVRDAFYVSLETHHAYDMQTNSSKTYGDVAQSIIAEVHERASFFIGAFDWMSTSATCAILLVLLKALYFRHSFLTSDYFENMYVTDDFVELDLRRAVLGRETLLPLNRREKKRYVPLYSCKLAEKERKRLSRTLSYLGAITVKICTHLFTDYALYWLLLLIRRHGAFKTEVSAPGMPTVQISGQGLLANILSAIVGAFQAIGIKLKVDTTPCLPDPSPPDVNGYWHILMLVAWVWVAALLEPLGLRVRHMVLRIYHPRRSRQRAIWLYNHIMRRRSTFVKAARRLLRRLLLPGSKVSGADIKALILAKCPWMRVVMGPPPAACLVCGETESSAVPLRLCPTPGCGAVYCDQCFGDIGGICPGCHMPLEYGDLSDISLERDSSDDEQPPRASLVSAQGDSSSSSAVSSASSDESSDSDSGNYDDDARVALVGGKSRGRPKGKVWMDERKRRRVPKLLGSGGRGEEDSEEERGRARRRRRRSSSSASSRHSYQYRVEVGSAPMSAKERAARCLPAHFRDVEAQEVLDLACMQQFDLPEDFSVPDFKAAREKLLNGEYRPGWALRNRKWLLRRRTAPVFSGGGDGGGDGRDDCGSGDGDGGGLAYENDDVDERLGGGEVGAGDFIDNAYLFSPITSEGSTKSLDTLNCRLKPIISEENISDTPAVSSQPSRQYQRETSVCLKYSDECDSDAMKEPKLTPEQSETRLDSISLRRRNRNINNINSVKCGDDSNLKQQLNDNDLYSESLELKECYNINICKVECKSEKSKPQESLFEGCSFHIAECKEKIKLYHEAENIDVGGGMHQIDESSALGNEMVRKVLMNQSRRKYVRFSPLGENLPSSSARQKSPFPKQSCVIKHHPTTEQDNKSHQFSPGKRGTTSRLSIHQRVAEETTAKDSGLEHPTETGSSQIPDEPLGRRRSSQRISSLDWEWQPDIVRDVSARRPLLQRSSLDQSDDSYDSSSS